MADTAYTFDRTTDEEKQMLADTLVKFGRNIGCQTVMFLTNNSNLVDAATAVGFKKVNTVYSLTIGG